MYIRIVIIFICLVWGTEDHTALGETRVKVGIFQNRPLSYTEADGEARGIYPALIKAVAQKENWTIDFVLDDWAGCLNRLEQRRIDLIVSIARSEEREKIYDFSKVPVVTVWGQVFGRKDHKISNILDLEGKDIGIVDRDITGRNLKNLVQKFRINADFASFPLYGDLCRAVAASKVDAVVMSNISGALFQREYDLSPTSIVFNPVDIYFAAPKGKNQALISAIDANLVQWKKDKNSVYYAILSHWHGNPEQNKDSTLKWIGIIAGIAGGAALVLFVWNRLLGIQVRHRTLDLKKSQEKYKTISQKALVGIYQITGQGQLTLVNQRMAQIFGYNSEQDFLDENDSIRPLFSDGTQFDRLIREIDETGTVEGKPMEFRSKDGQRIWGNLNVRRRDEEEGRGYEGFLEDISQRYRHDQLLRARLELSRYSATHSLDQVLQNVLDQAEQLTRSRMGFFHFLDQKPPPNQYPDKGQAPTALHTRTRSSRTPDQTGKSAPETSLGPAAPPPIWIKCVKDRKPLVSNDPSIAGSHMPEARGLRTMAVPIARDNDLSAILEICGKPSDYTDTDLEIISELADTAWEIILKKQSEEEIELTQKRFLAILNGIESTIYVADMETHEILFMNDYMKTLFKADLTGQICWAAFRHRKGPCPHCTNRFLLDENSLSTGIHLWEDRHPVTGRWNIYHDRAIKWVDGRMARLQIASDVTPLKEMEFKQREYENQIRQAQKLEAIGALASGIAHDFNNILFPILGYAELLNEEFTEDDPHKKSLDEILTGAKRARELVDQILTFSRQTEHDVAPLKPDLVIKEVIKLMRSTLPSTIRIEKYVAPDCKMIMADPTQIHQVAMNLMTNAFHAMEQTGGKLVIRLENVPGRDHELQRPGPHVRLRVEDTGIGMDKTVREKIFDPYFTTKPKGKGTGLGLSLVHGIVKKYKGEIKINSAPGQGTQIDVFIPARERVEQADIGDQGPEPTGGTERILLVDDQIQVLKLEREILERLGYRVESETSSKQALDLVTKTPDQFDLIITDMTMPEMTGDILTKKIREIAPDLPVIVCTGFSERINPDRAKELSVKAVLTKPVAKSVLTRTVRAVLDGEHPPPDPSKAADQDKNVYKDTNKRRTGGR